MSPRKAAPKLPICDECRQRHAVTTGRNPTGNVQSCTGHVRFHMVEGKRVRLPKPRPCGQPPLSGLPVCRYHGANAKAKAAGAARVTEAAAEKIMLTYGRPIETTATEALLEEVKWTAGHVAWLRERVQEVETRKVTFGVTEVIIKGAGEYPGVDATRAAGVNMWIELYHRERTHLVKVCAEAIKAGIEERKVRLAEKQGALVADVIRKILDDLNLSAEQVNLVGQIVPRHLRLLTG